MPSTTFHPCVPDNVQTTVQTQPDQKTGLVKTEWITPSAGTVPGPLGTEKIPRECLRPPQHNPHQMSTLTPSTSVWFPVFLGSSCF